MSQLPALVVFSHLRWNFVYQRPQHLISRLAHSRRVLFIEEPILDRRGEPRILCEERAPNVLVCEPHTPVKQHGFCDEQYPVLEPLVRRLLIEQGVDDYVLWFYSPMAAPLAIALQPKATIYDCMDELSSFANAPPQLLERESGLLERADAVFTGGPSLYRAKKDRHPRAYCFPSSVDAKHFGGGRAGGEESTLQVGLPHPRLGFFGVIDERFDAQLLDEVARTRPSWQFIIVGPVVKIDPAVLPRRSNIHYFGQQSYEELPKFLAGWDVCLLPFARNEATRYISPTKTLEYMAADRMIVSTPIVDVAEPYGHIVYLGDTPEAFRNACEQALAASEVEAGLRVAKMRKVLANTSWDATAAAMADVIAEVIEEKTTKATGAASQPLANSNGHAIRGAHERAQSVHANDAIHERLDKKGPAAHSRKRLSEFAPGLEDDSEASVVIIGAGPTGLSAAYHLDNAVLLEANEIVGGWCRSLKVNGFTFDYAGHIMFSNDPYVHKMYEMLLGDNVHWQDREAWVYSKQAYTRYPFQGSLYGLPADVVKECLAGAIEARFGTLGKAPVVAHGRANGHMTGVHSTGAAKNGADTNGIATNGCSSKLNDCCGDGIMESTAELAPSYGNGKPTSSEPANFEEFIYKVWGRGIAKHFALPYNRKLWAVPLMEMETSWLGGRVPMPDLEEMIDGALKPSPKPMGPNARFGYPLRGGFQALMDGFLPYIERKLRLNTRVATVSPKRRVVVLQSGEEIAYESLISTMPLPALIKAIGDEAPPEVHQAASALRNVSVRCVHLGIGRENLTEKHWIYYPEDTVFHRIFVQGNASPRCNPPGGFGLTCEITYSPHKPLPCDGDDLIKRCIDDCVNVGIIREDDPVWATAQCDLPYAYVVYDHARPKNVAIIRNWLEAQDIHLAGRYSEWEYYNSDHAFLAGKKVAERVVQPQQESKVAAKL